MHNQLTIIVCNVNNTEVWQYFLKLSTAVVDIKFIDQNGDQQNFRTRVKYIWSSNLNYNPDQMSVKIFQTLGISCKVYTS